MWWAVISILVVVTLVFWAHYRSAMSASDRVSAALDIVRSSKFEVPEGIAEAQQEDPELAGWVRSGSDCLMYFRRSEGNDLHEVIDVASGSFHPGLVIHYVNGKPVQVDSDETIDGRMEKAAHSLLSESRQVIDTLASKSKVHDGWHY